MSIPSIPSTNVVIRPLEIGGAENNTKLSPASGGDFGQMLTDAMDQLSQTEAAANDAITRLAKGEDIELHQVTMAMQEADIAFQLAIQVRNKIVESYQEVMRMQV